MRTERIKTKNGLKVYRLFAVWVFERSVLKNIFLRSQQRPETEGRWTLLRPRENIFQYGLTLTVKNLLIFLCDLRCVFLINIKFQRCELDLRTFGFVT